MSALPKIFISYRRHNSAPYSGRIYDTLVGRFGAEVFFDHYSIRPGAKFNDAIVEAMDISSVVLAVIAPGWADETHEDGSRLHDPNDMVRKELRAALIRDGLELIPLLVGGAAMPAADQLPDDLKPLVWRNAATLPDDPFWRAGMEALVAAITAVLERGATVADVAVAVESIQRGDYKTAYRRLSNILKEHESPEAYYYRGLASYSLGNFQAAIDDWDVAVHRAPGWAILYRQRANALSSIGMTEGALADYGRAIELEPQDPRAYLNRALLSESTGKLADALTDLQAALKLHTSPEVTELARTRLDDLRARLGSATA